MTVEVTLEYHRVGTTMLSTGRITSKENGLLTEESDFAHVEYRSMMKELAGVLTHWSPEEHPELKVLVQRTDRAGLVPYTLDQQTVDLMRTDPVAGIEALSFTQASPTVIEETTKRAHNPPPMPTLKVANATLCDAFGETVAFKVRGHELECPGCGFWGMFTTPGLLNDPERAGQVFKTIFACPKKCHARLQVSCHAEWGFVRIEDLLTKTKLDAFYFPRAWNGGQPWVSRESLQQKYDAYKKEKESIP